MLIIGTGTIGAMKIPPEVRQEITARSIKLMIEPTNKAVEDL
ncbi:MAG: hypothetical protein QF906_03770 [Dehalococcoidales bacterium]|nr:hypothetical protein [Dehalococcoidales bacterium]